MDCYAKRYFPEAIHTIDVISCIEINGHWDAFVAAVHDRLKADATTTGTRPRLQSQSGAPLPAIVETADRAEATALTEAA